MNQAEQLVTLNEGACGQTLSRPLQDGHGQMLVPAGTVVTPSVVEALRRREVAEIWVLDPAKAQHQTQTQAAALHAQRAMRLERLFRRTDGSDGSTRLLAIMRRYREVDAP